MLQKNILILPNGVSDIKISVTLLGYKVNSIELSDYCLETRIKRVRNSELLQAAARY